MNVKLLTACTLAGLSGTLLAQAPGVGEHISFVSYPIVRDTRTVPCWLSEYEDEMYYLTIQSDVSAEVQPPMLGHQVLVEGIVSDAPAICGGVVLEQVRLSVMPELNGSCNRILPAEERYVIDFNPRPPGPSAGRLAFAPPPGPREAPPPLEGPQRIEIHFDFDRGVSFRHPGELQRVMSVAEQIGARRMTVTGMRGAHRLSDGTLLRESESVAQRRAEEVAQLLQGAGLALETRLETADGANEADGIDDWMSRKVTVELLP